MKIPQVRDPNLPPLEELPESYHAKVNPLLSLLLPISSPLLLQL